MYAIIRCTKLYNKIKLLNNLENKLRGLYDMVNE